MATTRYSDQQGSKSRQNPCQVQSPESIGNLSASRRCLWVRTTVSTVIVWSTTSISTSELLIQATEKTIWCAAPSNKVIKSDSKGGWLHDDKLWDTLQGMASANAKTVHQTSSYREQPRSTSTVVAYPRPALSATKRTNHAPSSFDSQAQVSQGHKSCMNKQSCSITEVQGGGGLELVWDAKQGITPTYVKMVYITSLFHITSDCCGLPTFSTRFDQQQSDRVTFRSV